MTIKIFWQNPYLTRLDTHVKTVDQNQITLIETIFFAFSGGQESDHGSIDGYPVIKAEKIGREIFYTLPENHGLNINDKVEVVIDWDRRYKLMRLHFAAEIVLELVYRKYPNIQKAGAHISANKARIDFKCLHNLTEDLKLIQSEAQSLINSHLPIICDYSDAALERRYWKIDGFSEVSCGGTHVKNTQEIGNIKLKRSNPGKGLQRIEIFVTN